MELSDHIKVSRLDRVYLYESQQPKVEGTLSISSHHLIFSETVKNGQNTPKELWILYRMVDSVERRSGGTMLYLKCKDLSWLKFDIPGIENCSSVADSITELKRIISENISLCFPFFHRPLFKAQPRIHFSETVDLPSNGRWRISNANRNYELCPSYPKTVIVPLDCTDDDLRESADFRQGGRFPVLCFEDSTTGAVLMRSSQPLVGLTNRRSRPDEKLLNSVIFSDKKGLIIDLRSPQQTQIAKSKGGGQEPENQYTLWRKLNKPIELSSDSYYKFIDACCDDGLSVDKWLSRQESSGWLSAVKDTMQDACVTAQCLHLDGVSVLVHGGDGVDTTLAVSSVVQVILNPLLRTFRGFMSLIEREWLCAGHPFHRRYESGPFTARGKDNTPTFILFLDCMYQLLYQFPCSFEFNCELLLLLASHIYASCYGTFLCNSQKERETYKVDDKTTQLWRGIEAEEMERVRNVLYEENNEVIWPSVAPQSLQLWYSFYLRKNKDVKEENAVDDMIRKMVEDDRKATDKVKMLREELDRLQAIKKMREVTI